jgi:hypothetical protein
MTDPNAYAGFTDAPVIAEGPAANVNRLIEELNQHEADAEKHANALKTSQEHIRRILERELPEQIEAMGVVEFKTAEGLKVEIKEDVQAGISEANRGTAFKWLEDNGHAGLIKRNVHVAFNKGQEQEARDLIAELTPRFAAVSEDQKVHPSTLKAFVKEQLTAGIDIPIEPFGIFKQKTAKITQVKGKSKK